MDDELIFLGAGALIGTFFGLLMGLASAEPTELPNGCILHDDVIYCEVAE